MLMRREVGEWRGWCSNAHEKQRLETPSPCFSVLPAFSVSVEAVAYRRWSLVVADGLPPAKHTYLSLLVRRIRFKIV